MDNELDLKQKLILYMGWLRAEARSMKPATMGDSHACSRLKGTAETYEEVVKHLDNLLCGRGFKDNG